MPARPARIPDRPSAAPASDGGDAEGAEAGTEGAGFDVEWDEDLLPELRAARQECRLRMTLRVRRHGAAALAVRRATRPRRGRGTPIVPSAR